MKKTGHKVHPDGFVHFAIQMKLTPEQYAVIRDAQQRLDLHTCQIIRRAVRDFLLKADDQIQDVTKKAFGEDKPKDNPIKFEYGHPRPDV
jgi:hypothetical protein